VEVNQTQLRLVCDGGREMPIPLNIRGKKCVLQIGETLIFDLQEKQVRKTTPDSPRKE
jgi:hypothetical protein